MLYRINTTASDVLSFLSVMALWYALVTVSFQPLSCDFVHNKKFQLVSVISLSRGIQIKPDCSQLGRYAFRPDMREDLAAKFLVHARNKVVSVSLVSFGSVFWLLVD